MAYHDRQAKIERRDEHFARMFTTIEKHRGAADSKSVHSWVHGRRWARLLTYLLTTEGFSSTDTYEMTVDYAVKSNDDRLHAALWRLREIAYGNVSYEGLKRTADLLSSQTGRDVPQRELDWYFHLALGANQGSALTRLAERDWHPSAKCFDEMRRINDRQDLWDRWAPSWMATITRDALVHQVPRGPALSVGHGGL